MQSVMSPNFMSCTQRFRVLATGKFRVVRHVAGHGSFANITQAALPFMHPSVKPAVGQPLQVETGNSSAIQRTSSALDGPGQLMQETRALNRR